ncbi:MAG: HAD family phosphatase [Actinomycetota bacterium]
MKIGRFKIELVIFDMDGLMFDTERLIFRSWKESCKKYKQNISEEIFIETIGLNRKKTIEVYKKYFGDSFPYEELINETVRIFEGFIRSEGVPLKEGLLELLEYNKKKQLKMALATSTKRDRTELMLNLSGTRKYFDLVLCGDEIINGKPDPEIFLETAKKLNCRSENCIVLEDSKNGIIAAYRAGMLPIMVPDIIKPTKEIEDMVFKKFDSLKEVKSFFKDNFK